MGFDLYQHITDRIVSELEAGTAPWQRPWVGSRFAISHVTGKPYSIMNQMLLEQPGEHVTFNQVLAEGGHVRKGEKSKIVVFWKWLDVENKETGETEQKPLLRYFNVFHISQVEGIKPRHDAPLPDCVQPNEQAERILHDYWDREGIHVVEGNECSYAPGSDTITLPSKDRFISTAEYYSAACHESIHSSGAEKRLNRLIKNGFGSEPYSKEELVAEIGASFLINMVGLETPESFRNNAAYIGSWLKALKNDKRLIVSAAGHAQKAVDYILNNPAEKPQQIEKDGNLA